MRTWKDFSYRGSVSKKLSTKKSLSVEEMYWGYETIDQRSCRGEQMLRSDQWNLFEVFCFLKIHVNFTFFWTMWLSKILLWTKKRNSPTCLIVKEHAFASSISFQRKLLTWLFIRFSIWILSVLVSHYFKNPDLNV